MFKTLSYRELSKLFWGDCFVVVESNKESSDIRIYLFPGFDTKQFSIFDNAVSRKNNHNYYYGFLVMLGGGESPFFEKFNVPEDIFLNEDIIKNALPINNSVIKEAEKVLRKDEVLVYQA